MRFILKVGNWYEFFNPFFRNFNTTWLCFIKFYSTQNKEVVLRVNYVVFVQLWMFQWRTLWFFYSYISIKIFSFFFLNFNRRCLWSPLVRSVFRKLVFLSLCIIISEVFFCFSNILIKYTFFRKKSLSPMQFYEQFQFPWALIKLFCGPLC